MLDLILAFARDRDDIRAVILTGSRADPAAVPDPFQDYDITYLVESVEPYRQNEQIPRYFGEIMILQTPDDAAETYTYLMQFLNGNRLDLTFRPREDTTPILEDSLSVVLLDKDHRFALPPPTLRSYLPVKPTAKQFADCCNEFWWLNPYVAKGLYRNQLTYAKTILDGLMREQLMAMLTWHVGLKTNFQVSLGYLGKHLKTNLSPDLWDLLERTYSDARPDHIRQSLFVMDDLFRHAARPVADAFQFPYPDREDAAVSAFIRRIQDTCPL